MATQTLEFPYTTGQTLTVKLFGENSDTQVASVAATEATNRKGTYTVDYVGVAAGTYRFIAFVGSTPVYTDHVILTGVEAAILLGVNDSASIKTKTDQLSFTPGNLLQTFVAEMDDEVLRVASIEDVAYVAIANYVLSELVAGHPAGSLAATVASAATPTIIPSNLSITISSTDINVTLQ